MNIIVNGASKEVDRGLSIAALLDDLNVNRRQVAEGCQHDEDRREDQETAGEGVHHAIEHDA